MKIPAGSSPASPTNKNIEGDGMKVKNFNYDGLFGRETGGYAEYTAWFSRWTEDPGVAVCLCSDGKERLIPTFALEDFRIKDYPEQSISGCMIFYKGTPCKS